MPTYQYQCGECGITFERVQHFSEDPLTVCPECNGSVHRVPCAVGIVFKGKGFYVTDHRGDKSALLPKKNDDKPAEKPAEKSAEKPAEASSSDSSPAPAAPSTD